MCVFVDLESFCLVRSIPSILRELQGCLRGVSLKFQESFKDVNRIFLGSLKCVSRMFLEYS